MTEDRITSWGFWINKRYLIRFALSVLVVNVATAPYIFYSRAVRSAAGAPWLWAFLIEDFAVRPVLPTSTVILFLATCVLLGLAALTKPTCIIVSGWCVLNALVAFATNFQLYRA